MSLDVTYFRIERMIKSGAECFLCALEDEIERKYIDAYLSELVMDSKAREKIVESRGFCNHHFYRMLIAAGKPESPDGHGIALISQDIIEKLIQDLHKQKKNREKNFHQKESIRNCPACVYMANLMKICNKKIVKLLSLNQKEFLMLFKDSEGLCIPHFTALINALKEVLHSKNWEAVETIIEIEEKNLRRLGSELAEYIRRQSYEFSDQDRRAVEDVLLRSVQKMVGRRGLKLRNVSVNRMRKKNVQPHSFK
ncbi:MAG: DUF6062 family protein [Candidatus Bathyarchaeia archaeon]